MLFEKEEKKKGLKLRMEGELSIYEAASCREELLGCLEAEKPLEVDVSGVDRCDLAGLQVLEGGRKSAEQRGIPFTVTGASEALREIAADAGIEEKEIFG